MKGIVLYKTNCGSTKEYANWISEESGFESLSLKNIKSINLDSYDCIIIGGFVLANKIVISKWISKNWEKIKNKHVIVFSTSGAKPNSEVKELFLNNSFSKEIANSIKYFPMHGRKIHNDLPAMGKFMMWLGIKFFAKNEKEKEEMAKDVDGVDKSYISPLIAQLKTL